MHVTGDGDALADGHVAVYDVPAIVIIIAPCCVALCYLRGAVAGLFRLFLCWIYIGNLLLR